MNIETKTGCNSFSNPNYVATDIIKCPVCGSTNFISVNITGANCQCKECGWYFMSKSNSH